MTSTTDYVTSTMRLVVDPNIINQFSPILQQGVMVQAQLGTSIRNILCDQLGFSPDYVNMRINTIFLDGRPVDNIDTAVAHEGSVLALSGSMPGFVGAALRKGGFYATMRDEITHQNDTEAMQMSRGLFVLKLYNLLIPEMGPVLFTRGIVLKAADLVHFLRSRSSAFWSACRSLRLNDRSVDPNEFNGSAWVDVQGMITLKVYMA